MVEGSRRFQRVPRDSRIPAMRLAGSGIMLIPARSRQLAGCASFTGGGVEDVGRLLQLGSDAGIRPSHGTSRNGFVAAWSQ